VRALAPGTRARPSLNVARGTPHPRAQTKEPCASAFRCGRCYPSPYDAWVAGGMQASHPGEPAVSTRGSLPALHPSGAPSRSSNKPPG